MESGQIPHSMLVPAMLGVARWLVKTSCGGLYRDIAQDVQVHNI